MASEEEKRGDSPEGVRIQELEKKVATLTKENTRLKNEMRFTLDQVKRNSGEYIAALQNELEALESRNDQLSSMLMRTEAEVKNMKVSQARIEATSSAKRAAQSAALVERLTSVQREREKALATQLRNAIEEKEKVLKRLHQLEDGNDVDGSVTKVQSELSMEDTSCDKDLKSLFEKLQAAKGVHELQQGGSLLVQKVRQLRESNEKDIREKIEMLKGESEAALSKKQALEAEIARLRCQLEITETEYRLFDKTRVKALQTQLQAAIRERNEWQLKAEKFEDTVETLRVLSSLQRSLSKEDEIKKKYEHNLQKCRSENSALADKIEYVLKERNEAVMERNLIIQERNALALQVQQEFERAERFQRLVLVLRKKAMLASAGTSPTVHAPTYDI